MKLKQIADRMVAAALAISLTGCSLVLPGGELPERVNPLEMRQTVSRNISEQWEYIDDEVGELPASSRTADGEVDADLIVDQMLEEEHGREYLEFCYSVASGADADTVLERARAVLAEETYEQLVDKIGQTRELIYAEHASRALAIDEENRDEFYKDLRKLVVSTSVLLTATVVYSAMPHIYFWGKISALAAVSVSAGAAAGTVISVYDWYINDVDMVEAFDDWMKMITEEPYAAYLMATSVISLGQSMNLNPVSSSVILGVFTVFNALNIVREMVEAYGEES